MVWSDCRRSQIPSAVGSPGDGERGCARWSSPRRPPVWKALPRLLALCSAPLCLVPVPLSIYLLLLSPVPLPLGGPKIALPGGDGMGARRRRGGGVPEMGFRAGPFVLCKDRCCPPKAPEHKFWPGKIVFTKKSPPHMCSQNDQCDVGIILSHGCWGRTPPPPGTAGRAAPAQTPPPGTATKEGEGGGLGKWASVPPPPPRKAIFFPPCPCSSLEACG